MPKDAFDMYDGFLAIAAFLGSRSVTNVFVIGFTVPTPFGLNATVIFPFTCFILGDETVATCTGVLNRHGKIPLIMSQCGLGITVTVKAKAALKIR